jgi:hypothetical protein
MENYEIWLSWSKYLRFEDIFIFCVFSGLFHLSNFNFDIQRRIIFKIFNYLITMNNHQRILIIYSLFRILPINRVFDIVIDCFLSTNIEQYEWIFKS